MLVNKFQFNIFLVTRRWFVMKLTKLGTVHIQYGNESGLSTVFCKAEQVMLSLSEPEKYMGELEVKIH